MFDECIGRLTQTHKGPGPNGQITDERIADQEPSLLRALFLKNKFSYKKAPLRVGM